MRKKRNLDELLGIGKIRAKSAVEESGEVEATVSSEEESAEVEATVSSEEESPEVKVATVTEENAMPDLNQKILLLLEAQVSQLERQLAVKDAQLEAKDQQLLAKDELIRNFQVLLKTEQEQNLQLIAAGSPKGASAKQSWLEKLLKAVRGEI